MHLTTSTEPESAPSVGVGRAENRAWGFFGDSVKRAWKIDPQVVEAHLEKTTAGTTTASGIPSWPSRDPIGEEGGINLYGFVGNDGVNEWDYLGWGFGDRYHGDRIGTPFKADFLFQPTQTFKINRIHPRDDAERGQTVLREVKLKLEWLPYWKRIDIADANYEIKEAYWRTGDARAKTHELRHVEDHWIVWKMLQKNARRFVGDCATKEEFECYEPAWEVRRAAINVVFAYMAAKRQDADSQDRDMIYPDNGLVTRHTEKVRASRLKQRIERDLRSSQSSIRICQQKHRNRQYTKEMITQFEGGLQKFFTEIDSHLSVHAAVTRYTFPGNEKIP